MVTLVWAEIHGHGIILRMSNVIWLFACFQVAIGYADSLGNDSKGSRLEKDALVASSKSEDRLV
jgi:hypothetical protein